MASDVNGECTHSKSFCYSFSLDRTGRLTSTKRQPKPSEIAQAQLDRVSLLTPEEFPAEPAGVRRNIFRFRFLRFISGVNRATESSGSNKPR